MFKSCALWASLSLVLLAGTALGQPGIAPPDADRLGIYSTADCASDNLDGSLDVFTVYCVLTGTSAANVRAFEFQLRDDPAGHIPQVGIVLADATWFNYSSYPEFSVSGTGWVLPGPSQEVLLVSVDYLVLDTIPVHLYVEPVAIPSIPGEMAYFDSAGSPYAMYPVSGDHALPLFGFNTGPVWYNPGMIQIDAEPELFLPQWTLDGPGGSSQSGFGDEMLLEMPPGDYSLYWHPYPEWTQPPLNPVEFTLEPDGFESVEGYYLALPQIQSVADVPNDQGRRVRLIWQRCPYDVEGMPPNVDPITGYGVYRQQDGAKLAGWDYVGSVPARGDPQYQYVAPTLCDSTIVDGLCESTFMISAMTSDPLTYFDSVPDTGCSVDNLRPVTPAGFKVEFGAAQNRLTWDAPVDTDVDHYLVYRTGSADAPPDPLGPPLAQVFDTTYDDDGGWQSVYWLVAVDHAGNRSDLTDWAGAELTGIDDGASPGRAVLHDAAPNPFNPSTTLAFDLPRRNAVTLSVFNMSGQKVRDLLAGELVGAGYHEIVWNGRDAAGRQLASGTYVYRLEATGFSESKRMVLLK